MINRIDAFQVSGGDTIQMLQTKSALENLGVDVVTGMVDPDHPIDQYDIIHVFNWEQLQPVLTGIKSYNKICPPIVLSPIFWFHSGHWYQDAVSQKRIWKMIRQLLGSSISRKLYGDWQQVKFSHGQSGRTLKRNLSVPVRLLPNSQTEILHLKTLLNIKENLEARCTIVPNGINKKLFEPLPPPNQEFIKDYRLKDFVLQVARIQSAKNQLGLIEALREDTIPIVFIGQPSPYEPDYVNRCYEMGRQRGNVYFIKPQTPEKLAGIYRLAAVHVLPSWRETPGLVNLEAAAAGCRIVSTSLGSANEYFGDFAWYCNPGDVSSIRKAVLDSLSAPTSTRLREVILRKYTWDAAAQKTLEAYHIALNN